MEGAKNPIRVRVNVLASYLLRLCELLGILAHWLLLELYCDICDCPRSLRFCLHETHTCVGKKPHNVIDPKLVITTIQARLLLLCD